MKVKELVMLRDGDFAENPWGPVVKLVKGDKHSFPLDTAEELIEANAARISVPCPDFKSMKPGEIKKYIYGKFGVELDARTAGLEQKAIVVFEKATGTKYERPAAAVEAERVSAEASAGQDMPPAPGGEK